MTTPDTADLTCKEFVELVTDYLEGVLPPSSRKRFDEHLATCPYCTLYLEQMRQTIRTMGRLPEETIPPPALDALLEHFRKWR
jgi:anti-sigma factor RsiW